jgi:hypothetical protein
MALSEPALVEQTMKYYKYKDKYTLIKGGTRFIETTGGVVLREVTVNGDCFLGSNVCYPHWGLVLAEGKADYDKIEEFTPIAQEEFAAVWRTHLAQNAGQWMIIRLAYPVGTRVQGRVAIFYPQGVIVDLGDSGTLGVANYGECKASTGPENMYGRHKISATVGGYDEENQWLVLESPQVHE